MALHTLGTAAATSLNCLSGWSQVLSAADLAAIGNGMADDRQFATMLQGLSYGATAVIGTATTHASTTLDTIARVSGAALAQIHVGDLVIGTGIPPGTYVTAKASTVSITLSQAATTNASGQNVAFCRQPDAVPIGLGVQGGTLLIPSRGTLRLLPGDVVALDPRTGFPYLVPAASINIAGSVWTFT